MLAKLQSFIAISDLKSVSLAAKRLYLTQPALTQHIRFLERHFDVSLLKRVGNTMELTPEGKKLYDASKELVDQSHQLDHLFSEEHQQETLRFSTIDSVTLSILPAAIKAVLTKNPEAKLIPHDESSHLAINMLREGQLDLALCTLDHLPPQLGREVLLREKLIFIGTPKHRAIKTIRALSDLPMILFPTSSMTRGLIDTTLAKLKITPHIAFESIKVSAIMAFIEAGMGISLVPYYSAWKELKNGRIVEIPITTAASRSIGIAFSKGRPLTSLALAFIRELRNANKRLSKP